MKRLNGNLRALVFSAVADIRRGFDPAGFIILLLVILLILAAVIAIRKAAGRRRRAWQNGIGVGEAKA